MPAPQLAFLDLGAPELIIILIIVLLLFGSKKLPELSRSLGSSMGEFKKGVNEGAKDDTKKNQKNTPGDSSAAL